MSRRWIFSLAVMAALLVGAYALSPYWAAHRLGAIAKDGDVDQLNAAVDFPAVRESLKGEFTAALTDKMATDPEMKDNPFAGLAMMVMPTMINSMVDGLVRPEAFARMVRAGKVERKPDASERAKKVDYTYDYRDLDHFAVGLKPADAPSDDLPRLIFERRGLFTWKVIRVEIPASVFDQIKSKS